MRPFCQCLVALGFASLATILPAQEPPSPESAVIRSNVREVVLDVVARPQKTCRRN